MNDEHSETVISHSIDRQRLVDLVVFEYGPSWFAGWASPPSGGCWNGPTPPPVLAKRRRRRRCAGGVR
jgi:hypothetical protein